MLCVKSQALHCQAPDDLVVLAYSIYDVWSTIKYAIRIIIYVLSRAGYWFMLK